MNTTYFRMIYFTIVFFSIVHGVSAQEAVANNGKFVTVKGLKLYYEESGEGMPLLLLHNFFSSASEWQPITTEFSRRYRVIAVDLPGHNRSDYMDTTNVYLHEKAAEYMIGLLDALKIDSLYVIGASSGGFITLYMATRRPELIKKIVIVGGQIFYSAQTREVISGLGRATGITERLGRSGAVKMHGKTKLDLFEKQFWNFRKLYGDPSFTPDVLATIKAKALIIHGDNDRIAPLSNALEMHKNIPHASLWVVPNGGHLPHFVPANQADFLRRTQEFMDGDWSKNLNR